MMRAGFDAIVVGSGMSGGWVAKELTERGLKTLIVERGHHVEHGADYKDSLMPWELENFGMVPEDEVPVFWGAFPPSHAPAPAPAPGDHADRA